MKQAKKVKEENAKIGELVGAAARKTAAVPSAPPEPTAPNLGRVEIKTAQIEQDYLAWSIKSKQHPFYGGWWGCIAFIWVGYFFWMYWLDILMGVYFHGLDILIF